jgi:hypothetical protein
MIKVVEDVVALDKGKQHGVRLLDEFLILLEEDGKKRNVGRVRVHKLFADGSEAEIIDFNKELMKGTHALRVARTRLNWIQY